MTVLVTGANGFIGSHVVDVLVKKGIKVRALQHCSERRDVGFKSELVETVYGDIRNPDTCVSVCKDIDSVIHFAALINVDESRNIPRQYWEVNVGGTFNLLEAVRQSKVSRFTYMGTAEQFGNVVPPMADENTVANPSSPYAASKYCAERYCYSYYLTYGLPISIVIGFNVYGPRQKYGTKGALIATFARNALDGKPLRVNGNGQQTRDYTYITDMADGISKIHLSDKTVGQTVIIASGIEHRVIDIANEIKSITKSPSPIVFGEPRPGENMRSCGDAGKALNLLGWKPTTNFVDGLMKTLEYYRDMKIDA